jgi:hypothetical protein
MNIIKMTTDSSFVNVSILTINLTVINIAELVIM